MKPNDVVSELPKTPTPNTHASVDAAQQEQQAGLDFVRQVITDDLKEGRTQKVITRSCQGHLFELWYCRRV